MARRSTRDHGALARGEWIKFVAAFFNAEERANALYEQLVQKYEHYKRQASLAAEGEHICLKPFGCTRNRACCLWQAVLMNSQSCAEVKASSRVPSNTRNP